MIIFSCFATNHPSQENHQSTMKCKQPRIQRNLGKTTYSDFYSRFLVISVSIISMMSSLQGSTLSRVQACHDPSHYSNHDISTLLSSGNDWWHVLGASQLRFEGFPLLDLDPEQLCQAQCSLTWHHCHHQLQFSDCRSPQCALYPFHDHHHQISLQWSCVDFLLWQSNFCDHLDDEDRIQSAFNKLPWWLCLIGALDFHLQRYCLGFHRLWWPWSCWLNSTIQLKQNHCDKVNRFSPPSYNEGTASLFA